MSNYVTIEYPEVNLIMDLSYNCSLYPLTVIKKINTMSLSHLGYSKGFCEIDNAVSVIIDLSEFLKIPPIKAKKEMILLRMTGFNGDFSLIIPTPKFVKVEIDFKKNDLENNFKHASYPLVSSNYCILDNKVYLKVDGVQISRLLSDEISKYLTAQWSKSKPVWSNISEDNLSTVLKKSIISKKGQTTFKIGKNIDLKNTIILKIGKYEFSFSESLLSELTIFDHQLTKIPDSPEWVLGAYNFNNQSLALIELSTLFGLEKSTNKTQLIAVINVSKNEKLGLLCDSLDNVFIQPKDLTQFVPTKKNIISPYNLISEHESKFIFSINMDFLKNSVSNAKIIDIQYDWSHWRGFFTSDVNKTINAIKSKTGAMEQNKLIEYVEINYGKINILIELSKGTAIFPDQKINNIEQYPNYIKGIANLGSSNCLIIDFAMFLGIVDISKDENVLLSVEDGNNSNIALRIPKPKLVKFDILSKSYFTINDHNNISTQIPSSKYIIIKELIYLKIDQIKLFQYLRNELKIKLSETWNKSLPNFESIPYSQLADIKELKTRITHFSPQISTRGFDQDNLLICRVDNTYFGVNESDVIHLLSKDTYPTKIPNSPTWVEGLIEFQNEDIPLINLSNLFQIAKDHKSTPIIVIVTYLRNRIALKCDSIYLTTDAEQISIKPQEIYTYDLPFSNILETEGKILFVLNLDFILKSVMLNDKVLKSTEWEKLLSSNIMDFHNNQLIEKRSKIFENNHILAKIHQSGYSIPLNQIISIQSVSDKERAVFNNVNLVAYNGEWIPSFQIDLEHNDRNTSSYDISLILQNEEIIFELQVDKLKLINQGDQLINQSIWQALLKGNSPIGLTPPVDTDIGLAFGIDLESFVIASIRSLSKKNINPSEFIASIDIDPPSENIEDTLISKEMSQIWEEGLELYLVINNKIENEFHKFALQIDKISDITLYSPKGIEIINWEHGEAKSYFYVNLSKAGKIEKALKIPSNCYLFGIKKDNIKRENGETFLLDENEKIPLLNISNKQIGEI